MKRSIVTGGTGFVGANLAWRLVKEGQEVHLLVRPRYAPWRIEEIKRDVKLHEVDLRDADTVERTVNAIRPDWVFHLAAHGAYSSQTDASLMAETNIIGTINLVQSCLTTGFEAFVNTGTSSEYGFKSHAPSEEEALEPNSDYAVTKASATLFCRHAAQRHEANISTLRLYSVYGAFEEPTRLMPTLIMNGLEGRWPPLADPLAAHDFVYVDDVCDAYLLAAAHRGKERGAIYNVGTGRQTTLREVVEVARRVLAIEAEPDWNSMQARAWDTKHWAANCEKIRRELGWRAPHTFEQGFTRTLRWLREHPRMRELYKQMRRDNA